MFKNFVIFAWVPFVLYLFARGKPRRAVTVSFLAAWLFLPVFSLKVPGLPDYTKVSATTLGVLLGALLFDWRRLFGFRPGPADLPVVVWCLSPLPASLSNNLGLYDGLSTALATTVS